MTLRRYAPMKQSRGTTWPPAVKRAIFIRDGYLCVGPRIGMPGRCQGFVDPDHVRASGALGRKSRSTVDNGALLCRFWHHRMKTAEGRKWRPKLIAWIEAHPTPEPPEEPEHAHVEFVHGCAECEAIRRVRPRSHAAVLAEEHR